MRPRINTKFGKATYSHMLQYLTDNYVFGHTVKICSDYLIYSFTMMFRDNKKSPEILFLKISTASKLVTDAWTNKGNKFDSIDSIKSYTKKSF